MHKPRWKRGNMTTRKFVLRIVVLMMIIIIIIIIVKHMKVLNFEMWFIHPVVKHINWK
jgi:hypothetical protein